MSWLPLGLGRRDPDESKADEAKSEAKAPEVPRLSSDEVRRAPAMCLPNIPGPSWRAQPIVGHVSEILEGSM